MTNFPEHEKLTIAILRHEFSGAVHWHVIGSDSVIHEKFNHFEDAERFALIHVLPEDIEVSG